MTKIIGVSAGIPLFLATIRFLASRENEKCAINGNEQLEKL